MNTFSQEQPHGYFLASKLCMHQHNHRPIHDCDEGTTPKAKTPISTARRQPCSTSACCRQTQKCAGWWTLKKLNDHCDNNSCLFSLCTRFCPGGKSLKLHHHHRACPQEKDNRCARALPGGQELEVGPFPLEPNIKSQNNHLGFHKATLLSSMCCSPPRSLAGELLVLRLRVVAVTVIGTAVREREREREFY